MGLDQFAHAFSAPSNEPFTAQTDFALPEEGVYPLQQWRKHSNLQGWMEQLYVKKGGTNPDFNCATLRLDAEDIDALEAAVNDNALPETTGFFFGRSMPEDTELDREFIAKAREALAEGKLVAYDSWW